MKSDQTMVVEYVCVHACVFPFATVEVLRPGLNFGGDEIIICGAGF